MCVPTSPLVVSPQTKKVPNSNQNIGWRAARNSASIASQGVAACFERQAAARPSVSPKLRDADMLGRSGTRIAPGESVAAQRC
jgi:hypothetical protein